MKPETVVIIQVTLYGISIILFISAICISIYYDRKAKRIYKEMRDDYNR
jgi:hypothetical protein